MAAEKGLGVKVILCEESHDVLMDFLWISESMMALWMKKNLQNANRFLTN